LLIKYYCKLYKSKHTEYQGDMPDSETLAKFCNYPWPGNIRQLQNYIKKQMVFNSWNKVFEELFDEHPEMPLISSSRKDSPVNGKQSFVSNKFTKNSTSIISQFINISNPDKLFEDISLKKIKKIASDKAEKEAITFYLCG